MMVEIKSAQNENFDEIWAIINGWVRNERTGMFF
jgi:hypothetical protein